MAAFFGFLIFLFFITIAISGSSKQRKELLEWAIPRAVNIARAQGWVSPHRLTTQLNLTKSDAQLVLSNACQQNLLYQAVNGRYYIK